MAMRATLLSLAGSLLVAAQDSSALVTSSASYLSSSTDVATSTVSQPFTHTISVGYGGNTFSPDVTLADVGDIIEYDFFPPNHSVARAEYGHPCVPYEDFGVDRVGFFSQFKPVDAILSDPPTYSVRVNDTNPIFFYCTAPGSCINYGMVGVINPNASTSLATQQELAKQSTFMLQPGQPWPSEETPPTTTSSSSSTSTASTAPSATASAATTSAAAVTSSNHSALTSGAIAGVAIGAAVVALIAAVLLYMCGRQARKPNYTQHGLPQPYMSHPVSYIHPKHMSTMTSSTGAYPSPALPGYIPQHDPTMSPPLQHSFLASDAVAPGAGSDTAPPSSPSLSHAGFAAPAYAGHPPNAQALHYVHERPHGVHEMDTDQGGIMNFLRKASTRKSGVERYG